MTTPTPPPASQPTETPRTDRLRDSVIDALSRYHCREIYAEDFAAFVKMAFNDAARVERELAAAIKERDEWKECAQRVDAKMLHEQADHNKTVDRLIALRAQLRTAEEAKGEAHQVIADLQLGPPGWRRAPEVEAALDEASEKAAEQYSQLGNLEKK